MKIQLNEFAPALFQSDRDTAVVLRWPDWSLATREKPAKRDDWAILYVTGLGLTELPPTQMPKQASTILRRSDLPIAARRGPGGRLEAHLCRRGAGYWDVYQII